MRIVAKTADGRVISRADLDQLRPSTRWYPAKRKLAVELVLHDIITAPDLRDRFGLSRAEFAEWCQNYHLDNIRADRHPGVTNHEDHK